MNNPWLKQSELDSVFSGCEVVLTERKRSPERTVQVWDFNIELGDAIKEKYASLFIEILEVSNFINRKNLSKAMEAAPPWDLGKEKCKQGIILKSSSGHIMEMTDEDK